MRKNQPNHGVSTLMTHLGEGENPHLAHVMPIYQTSTFDFETVQSGVDIMSRQKPGYFYTRSGNPNIAHFARKVAYLEGLDLKLLNPWLPPGLALEGILTARTAGQWGNGADIRLAGQASVARSAKVYLRPYSGSRTESGVKILGTCEWPMKKPRTAGSLAKISRACGRSRT